ncbi:hypothetical protein SAMN05446037_100669 [Anaerovirgula multivorans]|uniref:Uncharacterized protein n=1 Tax=Anaerovirgula multivorans TaxID=312168 RepID=A0A239CQN8_9FIRM|nr:hypothetical protein [Anaerovirgula multivorans]SNS21713.1 hypothetical protein SAMN05446037_100669 [Anaerovirgula multivorans]
MSYNFKLIDYYVSNQSYVFKISAPTLKDGFEFAYIPISKFPSLLMLDYFIGKRLDEPILAGYFTDMLEASDGGFVTLDNFRRSTFSNLLGVSKKELGCSKVYPKQFTRDIYKRGISDEKDNLRGDLERNLHFQSIYVDAYSSSKQIINNSIDMFQRDSTEWHSVLSKAVTSLIDIRGCDVQSHISPGRVNTFGGEVASVTDILRSDLQMGYKTESSYLLDRDYSLQATVSDTLSSDRPLEHIAGLVDLAVSDNEHEGEFVTSKQFGRDFTILVESVSSIVATKTAEQGVEYSDLVLSSSDSFREASTHDASLYSKPRRKLRKNMGGEASREQGRPIFKTFTPMATHRRNTDRLRKHYMDNAITQQSKDLTKHSIGSYLKPRSKGLSNHGAYSLIRQEDKSIKQNYAIDSIRPNFKHLNNTQRNLESKWVGREKLNRKNIDIYKREKVVPLTKQHQVSLYNEKLGSLVDDILSDKFKDFVITNDKDIPVTKGQGLIHKYDDILKEGMDVSEWENGFFVPEDYDSSDPFNPYYPWVESYNKQTIQDKDWCKNWQFNDRDEMESKEGMCVIGTEGDSFKLSVDVEIGQGIECISGIVFNYKDSSNYYLLELKQGSLNPVSLYRVVGGVKKKILSPLTKMSLVAGQFYTVSIESLDSKVKIKVNNRLVYEFNF